MWTGEVCGGVMISYVHSCTGICERAASGCCLCVGSIFPGRGAVLDYRTRSCIFATSPFFVSAAVTVASPSSLRCVGICPASAVLVWSIGIVRRPDTPSGTVTTHSGVERSAAAVRHRASCDLLTV